MKYQPLFLSLISTILGASLFGDRPSLAEPAPIFQEIRDRLPEDFQMRLPARLPEFTDDLELHAFIPDDDVQVINMGDKNVFSVLISNVSNCEQEPDPEECIVGAISVTEALSTSALQPEDLPDDRTPVTLADEATGFYFTQYDQNQLVIWSQDNLGYLLFSAKCDDEWVSKQQMIEIAQSAANEPAIAVVD